MSELARIHCVRVSQNTDQVLYKCLALSFAETMCLIAIQLDTRLVIQPTHSQRSSYSFQDAYPREKKTLAPRVTEKWAVLVGARETSLVVRGAFSRRFASRLRGFVAQFCHPQGEKNLWHPGRVTNSHCPSNKWQFKQQCQHGQRQRRLNNDVIIKLAMNLNLSRI